MTIYSYNRIAFCIFAVSLSFFLVTPVTAEYILGDYTHEQALLFSQSVVGEQVNDHILVNQNNRQVYFSALKGKPVVVSFIYTSCYHYCPTITKNLDQVVEIANETLGEDSFNIISIGFDTRVDTPERMQQFAKKQKVNHGNWQFMSVDEDTIVPLTRDLGFLFAESPKGFDHLAQITILNQNGVVYRQIYGTDYTPQHVIEPLKELVYGQSNSMPVSISDWINNIRLFCTVYDPTTGRYRFDYSVILSFIIGILCLSMILFFIVHSWRTNRTNQ